MMQTDYLLVGVPYKQFDLSAEEDSLHCVYSNNYDCDRSQRRNHSISGPDPYFPWFNLGYDTGLDIIRLDESEWKIIDGITYKYMFLDDDVTDGIEYTYSVVAYDMGVEPTYVKSYKSIGNGQFETVIDTNFQILMSGQIQRICFHRKFERYHNIGQKFCTGLSWSEATK